MKVIFLDIDGVLHKLSDVYKNNEFKYVLNLYLLVSLLIRSGLKVDITISSARRLNQSIDDFKLALSSNSISKDIISMLNKKDIDTTCPEIFSETKFNIETEDGRNMNQISELLGEAINSIIDVKEETDIDSLFSSGGTSALLSTVSGLDDFELICFLVVK